MKEVKLTAEGKQDLALALLLWKDFKADGKTNPTATLQMFEFSDMLGVRAELEGLLTKLPPFKIEPRK
jgi:hypothetical protein